MINELSNEIWLNDNFQKDLSLASKNNISSDLETSASPKDQAYDYNLYSRLAKSASIFSLSENHGQREAAYRIAATLIKKKDPALSSSALKILENLGNFPAIQFGFGSPSLEMHDLRSASLFLNHIEKNQIQINNKKIILTNFQRKLWKSLYNQNNTVVSAPTSAGKSFVVQHYIADAIHSGRAQRICYIVPSRALISQVSDDLRALITSIDSELKPRIINIPDAHDDLLSSNQPTIYILTQERLHILLDSELDFDFDIITIDEAQSISDGGRGILLLSAISRSVEKSRKEPQTIFICPYANVQGSFPKIFPDMEFNIIKEEEGSVSQNLISIDIDSPPTKTMKVNFIDKNKTINLGKKETSLELIDNNYAAIIAHTFGGNAANLIYAPGPAKSEEIARMLYQLESSENITNPDNEKNNLADLAERAIHPKFLLAKTAKAGIGFHYGRLPALVRKEIENEFSSGRLKYLVTTSTLLYGVNLPAKNLFIEDPTKGNNELLSGPEFWNLAGRAGRLGKEFEGNIFLINMKGWEADLTKYDKNYDVKSALSETIIERHEEILELIESSKIPSGKNPDIENAAAKLFLDYRSDKIERTLSNIGSDLPHGVKDKILAALDSANPKIDIDDETLQRNQTISAQAQQRLKKYFIERIKRKGVTGLIPSHPLIKWNDALDNYRWVFKRIHTHLEMKEGRDGSHFFFAPLALRWMRGDPLPRIIDDQIDYKKSKAKKGTKINENSIIRETLKSIENDLRFRYVKYLSCYTSVLSECLVSTGNPGMVTSIPNLSLYMEMGASSKTMLSLLDLGISRVTASLLTRQLVNKDMGVTEVLKSIRNLDLLSLDLPNASINEIRQAI